MNGNHITMHMPGGDIVEYVFNDFTNEYDSAGAHTNLSRRSHGVISTPSSMQKVHDRSSVRRTFCSSQVAFLSFDRNGDGTIATKWYL
ncbi:hypothetical protein GJ496_002625 [Pomphorhynchus laevis]|nr:hypothetical protein GJ496_002625 [Pomphorhynchus laevis]